MAPAAAVSVIVPTRGPHERLARLLGSLRGQGVEHQTLVVDNASPGEGVRRLCEAHEGATAIRLERNAGYSAAVNLAARRAEGEVLVPLNDDCVCDPGFLEALAGALDPARSVVMAAAVLRDARDPGLIETAGIQLDHTLLAFDYLNGEPLSVLEDEVADPLGPSGAAAAFDRDAFLSVGGFDEALFAYWEDVDLVLRMRGAGGRCALAPAATGTHEHSATLGSGSAEKNLLMGFGRGYVLRKWRVLSARRLLPVLAREAAIVAGQLALDRNAGGLRGRLQGWRAARPSERYPAEAVRAGVGEGMGRALARRYRRRRRIAAGP